MDIRAFTICLGASFFGVAAGAAPLNNTEPSRNDTVQPSSTPVGPEYTTAPTPEPRGITGMVLTSTKDGIWIKGVMPGSPADKAGLRSGDQISTVDSVNVFHVTMNHGERQTFEGLTEIPAVSKLLVGEPGRSVFIMVFRYESGNAGENGIENYGGDPKFLSFTVVRASRNVINAK